MYRLNGSNGALQYHRHGFVFFRVLNSWVRRPARVIFHTKVTVYVLKLQFIHVLNFWVPERARLIYHVKKQLYVLNFEYARPRTLRDRLVLNIKRKFRKYFSSKINDFQHTSLYYAAHFSQTNMNLYFLLMVLIIFHSPQTKPPIAITPSQMTSIIFCWKKCSSTDADQYWYHNNTNRPYKK